MDTNKQEEYLVALQKLKNADGKVSDKELDKLFIDTAKKFFPNSTQRVNDDLNDDYDKFIAGKLVTRFLDVKENPKLEKFGQRPQDRNQSRTGGHQNRSQGGYQNNRPSYNNNQPRPQSPYSQTKMSTQVTPAGQDSVSAEDIRKHDAPAPVVEKVSKPVLPAVTVRTEYAPAPKREPTPGEIAQKEARNEVAELATNLKALNDAQRAQVMSAISSLPTIKEKSASFGFSQNENIMKDGVLDISYILKYNVGITDSQKNQLRAMVKSAVVEKV